MVSRAGSCLVQLKKIEVAKRQIKGRENDLFFIEFVFEPTFFNHIGS
jgi:hypothetical protein